MNQNIQDAFSSMEKTMTKKQGKKGNKRNKRIIFWCKWKKTEWRKKEKQSKICSTTSNASQSWIKLIKISINSNCLTTKLPKTKWTPILKMMNLEKQQNIILKCLISREIGTSWLGRMLPSCIILRNNRLQIKCWGLSKNEN